MATRTNTVDSTDLDAATVTPVASADTLVVDRFNTTFATNTSKPAVDLAAARFSRGWTGNFDGSPLNIQCSAGTMVIEFGGDFFRLSANSGAGTIADLLFNPVKSSAVLDLKEAIVPALRALRGNVYMADSVTPTTVNAGGDSRWLLKGTTHAMTTINVSGRSFVETEKGFTTANLSGSGRLKLYGTSVAVAAVNLNGGTLELIRANAFSGTFTGVSGVIDASQLQADLNIGGGGGTIGPDVLIILPTTGAVLTYSGLTQVGGGPRIQKG